MAGCVRKESPSVIQINKFEFQFPSGYYTEPLKSFNSDRGFIKSESDSLIFEYEASTHVRAPIKTVSEYLRDQDWEVNVDYELAMKFGVDKMSKFQKSELQATRINKYLNNSTQYYVTCSLDSVRIDIPIIIPEDILNTSVNRDTLNGFIRETYIPNAKGKGVFGVYIQPLQNLDGRSASIKILADSSYLNNIDTANGVFKALLNFIHH